MTEMKNDQTPQIIKVAGGKPKHPMHEIFNMFLGNHAATLACLVLSIIVTATLIGPLIYTTDPFEMVWAPFTPPGHDGFILGTDYLGRDLLAGILNGIDKYWLRHLY